MSNLAEIRTEPPIALPRRAAFIAKTILRALVTLSRLLRVAMEIRDILANQKSHLKPEEAAKVLKISKTKLQWLKDNGVLIEGVHYWQDENTVRYFPDFTTKPFNSIGVETHASESTTTNTAHGAIDESY